jgi:hypothetical protein
MLGLEREITTLKIKSTNVSISENQILLKELSPNMKRWEELIRKNAFGTGGHRDHLPASLAHMLFCIVAEQHYNLAYFFIKRIERARATPKANLPYGMFLTRLYCHVIKNYPDLDDSVYKSIYPTLRPLVLKQARKPRGDKGKSHRHSFHGSSSHQEDDEDEDYTHHTPSPTTFVDDLEDLDYTEYQTPSPSSRTNEVLFERQIKLLNQTQRMHEEMRGGFKSLVKAIGGLFRKKK